MDLQGDPARNTEKTQKDEEQAERKRPSWGKQAASTRPQIP